MTSPGVKAGFSRRRSRRWSSPSRFSSAAVPPVHQRAGIDAVQGRPRPAALAQSAVLEQLAHLLVAQDGEPVVGARVPGALPGLEHVLGVDGERRDPRGRDRGPRRPHPEPRAQGRTTAPRRPRGSGSPAAAAPAPAWKASIASSSAAARSGPIVPSAVLAASSCSARSARRPKRCWPITSAAPLSPCTSTRASSTASGSGTSGLPERRELLSSQRRHPALGLLGREHLEQLLVTHSTSSTERAGRNRVLGGGPRPPRPAAPRR